MAKNNAEIDIPTLTIIFFIIGLLGVILLSFGGLYFMFKNTMILPAVIVFLGFVIVATLLFAGLNAKNHNPNEGIRAIEIVSLVLLLGLAVASYFPVSHFFNLEYAHKLEIQEDGRLRAEELKQMTEVYEQEVNEHLTNIEATIDNIQADYENLRNLGATNAKLEKFGVEIRSAKELPGRKKTILRNYKDNALRGVEELKSTNAEIVAISGGNLKSWNRPFLFTALEQIENQFVASKKHLETTFPSTSKSGETAWNEKDFEFTPKTQELVNIVSNRTALVDRYQPAVWIPILLLFFGWLFIISPYLATKRAGKHRIYDESPKEASGGISM